MGAKEPSKDRGDRGATSPHFADTQPTYTQANDFSFLEIIMAMQGTLGKLTEAVESLKTDTKSHSNKLDAIGKDVHAAKVVVGVAGTLIVGVFALVGWVAKAYLDYLSTQSHKP